MGSEPSAASDFAAMFAASLKFPLFMQGVMRSQSARLLTLVRVSTRKRSMAIAMPATKTAAMTYRNGPPSWKKLTMCEYVSMVGSPFARSPGSRARPTGPRAVS